MLFSTASLFSIRCPNVATATSALPTLLSFASERETLQAELYGDIPADRVAILIHGQNWDASGWRNVAPRLAARGVAALAVNLRGYAGSSGKTNRYRPNAPWTPVTDLRAAKAALRGRGASEIALVGASMGGSAVLASSFENDVECVVAVSAPVAGVPEELAKKITGRKLFVCADRDSLRAAPNVLRCFTAASSPKTLVFFGGREHSRAMFTASYGEEAISAIVEFVCRRG
ncbi:MAG: alpha/beta fold hydrolase [Chloroflexi bacterium]|nr:MAG: alpha/beta fold hydrolase [Chloroflexota bacterium]